MEPADQTAKLQDEIAKWKSSYEEAKIHIEFLEKLINRLLEAEEEKLSA